MASLRTWSITLLTAVVTAAVLLAAVILLFGDHTDHGAQASPEALSTAARSAARASGGTAKRSLAIGPEGIPLSGGAPLGPARSPAPGSTSGGVPCGSREQLKYHVHARLTIFVNGKPRSVPLGIGIAPPLRITKTRYGAFASGGRCFSLLHTHAADGVIHIEAPRATTFTLGQFFDVWEQRLDAGHVGALAGRVVAYVNGRRYRANPRTIPLRRHAQIQLELGRPRVTPVSITFPPGL